ncbi:ROK family protein [Cohnella nanjingensis]|uniref:ROK family protein n=1 Tax=Cohnella nanjingensis TaxID=1387779 RepID=A0A7X0RNJ8_9BACL|nr:ROK family protein [Cohnella nanjingensis]MBB6670772.1 ROK family protein [Cohnella nanjingensis]
MGVSELFGGIDIGGTKCAASLGRPTADSIEIIGKKTFPTPSTPEETLATLSLALDDLLREHESEGRGALQSIGVSCGGPLDSARGLVLSPPNLPGWDRIDVVAPWRERYGVPAALQNDANACALAEWKWGAGRGTRNMVFLTFGTGMGAGLILNGRLYAGTNDMAGEVGHIRMEESGPLGYGKEGSFEGFCSGGGIALLARCRLDEWLKLGYKTMLQDGDPKEITAKRVGEAAQAGDELALAIIGTVARQLGRGLAVLIDVLNPEVIVIGSIYTRQESLLAPLVLRELRKEALPRSLNVCRIVPAGLGEKIGDAAGLSVALLALEQQA